MWNLEADEGREGGPGQAAETVLSQSSLMSQRGLWAEVCRAGSGHPQEAERGSQSQDSTLHVTFTVPLKQSEDRSKLGRGARDRLSAKGKWRPCRSFWGGTHCTGEHGQLLLPQAVPSSHRAPSCPWPDVAHEWFRRSGEAGSTGTRGASPTEEPRARWQHVHGLQLRASCQDPAGTREGSGRTAQGRGRILLVPAWGGDQKGQSQSCPPTPPPPSS